MSEISNAQHLNKQLYAAIMQPFHPHISALHNTSVTSITIPLIRKATLTNPVITSNTNSY